MRIQKLEKFFRENHHELFVFAISLTHCRQSAEDVVHDALIAIAETPTEPDCLKSYVYRTVRNKALLVLGNQQKKQSVVSDYLETEQTSPEDQYFHQQVMAMIHEMSVNQQQALIMKLMGGLTLKEIAEITDTSIHTVASRYRRGLSHLQEKLNARV